MPNGSGINPSEMTVRQNRPVARRRQRRWTDRRIHNPVTNHNGKTKQATMMLVNLARRLQFDQSYNASTRRRNRTVRKGGVLNLGE